MKKSLLLCALIFGLVTNSMAQNDEPLMNNINTRYKGYVVTNSNDTIRGYLLNSNKVENQYEVLVYNNIHTPNPIADFTFIPNDVKEYKVGARHYVTFPMAEDKDPNRKVFLLREVKGPISLFEYYSEEGDPNRTRVKRNLRLPENKRAYNIDESKLQRNNYGYKNGVLTDMSGSAWIMSYKKVLADYVSDYPELAKKIADKEKGYGFINKLKHVYEYNDWAKANKK